ncbi:PEB3 protein, partial [Acromyrmex heyeri]
MSQLSRIALIIAMNVLLYVHAEEHYTDDNAFDIDSFLRNDSLRIEYYKCYMNTGPCNTPEQKELTGMFSEAYHTKCKKCTEKQKEIFSLVINWYKKNDPDKWQLILAKSIEDMKKKVTQ